MPSLIFDLSTEIAAMYYGTAFSEIDICDTVLEFEISEFLKRTITMSTL